VSKSASQSPAKESKGAFLKAVGAVAAVVSLLLALNQITGLVQNLRVHHKEFSEAMKSGEQEQQREDYGAAFHSFKHATELDPIDKGAQAKETEAAILWLDNVHANETQTFTQVANQLLPVFDSALSKAKGQAAGDILAHIAWANFLKYREGMREGVNVDGNLKAAFAADQNNVYAHTISGFWILWQGGDIKSAEAHFSAALTTGRVRTYVRDLQISGLTNSNNPENDAEELRVANDMRNSGELMLSLERRRIFWNNFTSRLHSPEELAASLSVLSPADTEATYDWLDDGPNSEGKAQTRAFVMANLKEITGNRAEALAAYQALRKQMHDPTLTLISIVDLDIKRLSHAKK